MNTQTRTNPWSLLTAIFAAAALSLVPLAASAQVGDPDIVRAEPDEINEPYDELEAYDESEAVSEQVLVPMGDSDFQRVATAGQPTLGELIDSAEGVSVISVSSTSVDLDDECQIFYGVQFNVDETLMGSTPMMHERRLGQVDRMPADECRLVVSESDVEQRFEAGERLILVSGTDWGDVVLPYTMYDGVLLLTD